MEKRLRDEGIRDRVSKLQQVGRDEKRSLILAEATNLFNSLGYHDTRLEDVAAELGTAKTSISYHFKSKQALLAAAYEETAAFQREALARATGEPDGLSRILKWVEQLGTSRMATLSGSAPPLALVTDVEALDEPERSRIGEAMSQTAEALMQFLRAGRKDGSVKVSSIEASAFFLLNIPIWLWPWLDTVIPPRRERSMAALLEILRAGIATDRNAPLDSRVDRSTSDNSHLLFDRQARNRMKTDAIVRAATRHLNQSGFSSLSLVSIAEELGASRGSIYYHFEDRDALLAACVDRTLDLIEKAISTHAGQGPNALIEAHDIFSQLYDGHISDLDPLLQLSMIESLPRDKRRPAEARLRRLTAHLAETMVSGETDGSMRSLDIEHPEIILLDAALGATRQRMGLFGLPASGSLSNIGSPADFFAPFFTGLAGRSG